MEKKFTPPQLEIIMINNVFVTTSVGEVGGNVSDTTVEDSGDPEM